MDKAFFEPKLTNRATSIPTGAGRPLEINMTETEVARPVSGSFTVERGTLKCRKLQVNINNRNIRGQGVLYLIDTGSPTPDRIVLSVAGGDHE